MSPLTTKTCKLCGSTKPLDLFAKRGDGRGRNARPECQDCYTSVLKAINLRRYGLTLEQWNEMYAAQDGRCAICRKSETELGRSLSVDHWHTGDKRVRQLLCAECNRGLGVFKDNPDLLREAAAYLERHQTTPNEKAAPIIGAA